jgi:hypothetical protein
MTNFYMSAWLGHIAPICDQTLFWMCFGVVFMHTIDS